MNDMNNPREKNPFFLPALIATFIPAVIFAVTLAGAYLPSGIRFFGPMDNLLFFLMFASPFVSIILSVAGLVDARKLQEPFIGCLLCLVLSLLVLCSFFWVPIYLQRTHKHPEVTIVEHSYSSEEVESINEELNRIMHGGNTTETS
ncbi:MAG: hypothetical protein J6W36_06340 [Clostridiales bacterium]|nr:hypothetical protein [Clostridiales bacterium]